MPESARAPRVRRSRTLMSMAFVGAPLALALSGAGAGADTVRPARANAASASASTFPVAFVRAVAFSGPYAYAIVGGRVVVVDFRDPARPKAVGHTEPLRGYLQAIAVAPPYVFVGASEAGLRIVDVRDPANPSEIGALPARSTLIGVCPVDHYVYTDDGSAMRVIDVADPRAPREIFAHHFADPVSMEYVGGGLAFVLVEDSPGYAVFDARDPAAPRRIEDFDPREGVGPLVASGGFLYMAAGSAGLLVLDAADPMDIRIVGTCVLPAAAWDVEVSDRLAYIEDSTGALWTVDIGDSRAPRTVGQSGAIGMGPIAGVVDGSHAVALGRDRSVLAVSVGDPLAMRVLGSYAPRPVVPEWIGQLGGSPAGVTVTGSNVFVGVGPRVHVIDFSRPDEAMPAPHSASEPMPANVTDVDVDENPNPNNPMLVYVAAGRAGLRILDVHRGVPVDVGACETGGFAAAVDARNGYAHVVDAEAGALRIVDASNYAAPREVASVEIPGGATDVQAIGRYAYVVGPGGLSVVDLLPRDDPQIVGALSLPDDGTAVDVPAYDPAIAYVGSREAGLRTVDVTRPSEPRVVGATAEGFDVAALVVDGGTAYAAERGGGLRVFDVTVSTALVQIGGLTELRADTGLVLSHGYMVATGGATIQVVDARRPSAPRITGALASFLEEAWDVVIEDDIAYVAAGASGLVTVDLADPSEPAILGTLGNLDAPNAVVAQAGVAYLADGHRVRIVSVQDPSSPRLLASYRSPFVPLHLAVSGRVLYVAEGDEGVRLVDVGDPAAPRDIAAYDTPGTARDVAVDGTTVYVADGAGGLRVLDASDPAAPREIGSLDVPGATVADVALSGTTAYVGAGEAGLVVVDVALPRSPRLVSRLDLAAWTGSVTPSRGRVWAAAGDEGVIVVDVSDRRSPREETRLDTPSTATHLAFADSDVIVADAQAGVLALRGHPLYAAALPRVDR